MSVGSTWMGRSIDGGNIPDWYSQEGGHAIVMAGYRKGSDGKTQYLIHNSWGESWGDTATRWIDESMLPKWLRYAYKLKLDAGGAAPVAAHRRRLRGGRARRLRHRPVREDVRRRRAPGERQVRRGDRRGDQEEVARAVGR